MTTTATQDWKAILPPIFADAVGHSSYRYSLAAPFVQGNHIYATDGRIAVRVPKVDVALPVPEKSVPDVDSLQWWTSPTAEALTIPTLPPPRAMRRCNDCQGAGQVHDCFECNGTGGVVCQYDDDHDCPRCDARGIVGGIGKVCEECDGTGKVDPEPRTVKWSDALMFSEKYIRMPVSHGCRVIHATSARPVAARFTLEGGVEGLVIGLVTAYLDDIIEAGDSK